MNDVEARMAVRLMAARREGTEGAALLNDACRFIRRYVVLSDAQASLIALWIMATSRA